MKAINIILALFFIFIFNGCSQLTPTYEVFEYNRNWNIGKSHVPNLNPNLREIYSEDKYIYIIERPKECVVGYLTNRDDKPEKVIEWIIISGKEYCKATKSWVLFQ